MKKIFTLLLALVMVFSFAACGGEKDDSAKKGTSDATENSTEEQKELIPVEFEPVVVVDDDNCYIEIVGYADDYIGKTIEIKLENRSDSTDYIFSTDYVVVDGVEVQTLLYQQVNPGESAEAKISITGDDLEKIGLTEYTDIALSFVVDNGTDIFSDAVVEGVVAHIYPYGEENASVFVREPKDTDVVIVDNEYVKVTVIESDFNILNWYDVYTYIENKSDKQLCLYMENVTVNGKGSSPFFFPTVTAGNSTVNNCMFIDLEDLEITDVEEIEFDLCITDYNEWIGEDLASEHVVYKP